MPEEVQQPAPQPQVTTASKPHNWKKVGFTIVFIVGVVAVISGIYWFMVINKSSEDSDLTGPVPKVTIKTSTESAKEATPSAGSDYDSKGNRRVDEWSVYVNEEFNFLIKNPLDFKYIESKSPPWSRFHVTFSSRDSDESSFIQVSPSKEYNSLEDYINGGSVLPTSTEVVKIGGKNFTKAVYPDNHGGTVIDYFVYNDKIGYQFSYETETDLKKMLETFDYIE